MNEKIFGEKIKIADIILVSAILLIALSFFIITELTRKEGSYVKVSINGETVAEYPLDRDGAYSLNGGTNILEIKDGKAFMKEANCPRQICVNDGKISRVGERITCLENRVEVIVTGEGEGVLEVG